MVVRTKVNKSEYHDSVSLMLVARELSNMDGVDDAAVMMGTEANKGILKGAGLLSKDGEAATANDLIIAVFGKSVDVLEAALVKAEELLKKKAGSETHTEFAPKTLKGAVSAYPEANVAVISVAGQFAVDEAWDALNQGLHVLLFSDNVAVKDEVELKKFARDHGLLLMGPGAGTSILNHAGLGFANVVPKGNVGIVSAAGTGLQEVSTLLARFGVGISQGIGVGGRDLKKDVGGIMTLEALKAFQADPQTEGIILISKPPAESVMESVIKQISESKKPTIICSLGVEGLIGKSASNATHVNTLYEASLTSAKMFGGNISDPQKMIGEEEEKLKKLSRELQEKLSAKQKYLRGLFSGGTLCYETQIVLRNILDSQVYSNAPLPGNPRLPDSNKSQGHSVIDLGEEEFTVGRPHPMIDNDLRIRRMLQEANDPEVGVILMDVVIGHGAHPDPASELGNAVLQIREEKKTKGQEIIFIASVTGTDEDPQNRNKTKSQLEKAGVIVCESNAAAAKLAGFTAAGKEAGK